MPEDDGRPAAGPSLAAGLASLRLHFGEHYHIYAFCRHGLEKWSAFRRDGTGQGLRAASDGELRALLREDWSASRPVPSPRGSTP